MEKKKRFATLMLITGFGLGMTGCQHTMDVVGTHHSTLVDIKEVHVVRPRVGATPVSEVIETAQFTGTVLWNPAHDTFAHDLQYTAEITLKPKADYTLSGVSPNFFSVIGAEHVTHTTDPSVFQATFPKTLIEISGMLPGNAATVNDTKPTFTWNSWQRAYRYELQIAEEQEDVQNAPIKTIPATDTSPSYTPTEALRNNQTYYWRVRAKDRDGIYGAWADTVGFTVWKGGIGDSGPAGGIVFYDKGKVSEGWRFLEAWTTDEKDTYQWSVSNPSEVSNVVTSTQIGSGYANTKAIANKRHPAAQAAWKATHGGKDDWFLPSKDELDRMAEEMSSIPGFASDAYWSSSRYEEDEDKAWYQVFDGSGWQNGRIKSENLQIRVIRAF